MMYLERQSLDLLNLHSEARAKAGCTATIPEEDAGVQPATEAPEDEDAGVRQATKAPEYEDAGVWPKTEAITEGISCYSGGTKYIYAGYVRSYTYAPKRASNDKGLIIIIHHPCYMPPSYLYAILRLCYKTTAVFAVIIRSQQPIIIDAMSFCRTMPRWPIYDAEPTDDQGSKQGTWNLCSYVPCSLCSKCYKFLATGEVQHLF